MSVAVAVPNLGKVKCFFSTSFLQKNKKHTPATGAHVVQGRGCRLSANETLNRSVFGRCWICLLACLWSWYQGVHLGPKHRIIYIKYVCNFVYIEYTSVKLRKINSYGTVKILYQPTTSVCQSEGCVRKTAVLSSQQTYRGSWNVEGGLVVVPGTSCFHLLMSV